MPGPRPALRAQGPCLWQSQVRGTSRLDVCSPCSAYASSRTRSTESTPTATSASAPARARWAVRGHPGGYCHQEKFARLSREGNKGFLRNILSQPKGAPLSQGPGFPGPEAQEPGLCAGSVEHWALQGQVGPGPPRTLPASFSLALPLLPLPRAAHAPAPELPFLYQWAVLVLPSPTLVQDPPCTAPLADSGPSPVFALDLQPAASGLPALR